ncbi:MAG: hypothetical protein ABIG89_06240 [Candidatus Woesearchaeota archaeon]
MAKVKKKAESGIQLWKKKKWFQIIGEKVYDNAVLGETPIEDTSKIIGRTINVNLMSVTGDMKKQNTSLVYKIHSFKDNKFYALPIGYKISSSYIKRIVRRGKNRIDDSFVVKTKDNKIIRIKMVLLTRNLTCRSARSLAKNMLQHEAADIAGKLDFYQFMNDILNKRFQIKLSALLSKVYPIRQIEIKLLKIEEKVDPESVIAPAQRNIKKLIERYKKKIEEKRAVQGSRRREDTRRPQYNTKESDATDDKEAPKKEVNKE